VDPRFLNDRFPRSSKYHPDWIAASVSGGACSLWLTEWLTSAIDLRPGMRVLDLGCGRAASSIFLRREFGVEVWATDLWFSPTENRQRIEAADIADGVFPIHADARSLPYAGEFFDAIVSIDSFMYYGSEDYFLSNLARFLKPGGTLGIALAGITNEMNGPAPEHLRAWWNQDQAWSFHSAAWWRRHWEKTGIVQIDVADSMPDGWRHWIAWHREIAPNNRLELETLAADQGQWLTYVRVIARRLQSVELADPAVSIPYEYTPAPLMRDQPR